MDAGPRQEAGLGGNLDAQLIEYLAIAAICGISPSAYLKADPVERDILTRIANKAQEIRQNHSKEQAVMIIDELGKALKRKRK